MQNNIIRRLSVIRGNPIRTIHDETACADKVKAATASLGIKQQDVNKGIINNFKPLVCNLIRLLFAELLLVCSVVYWIHCSVSLLQMLCPLIFLLPLQITCRVSKVCVLAKQQTLAQGTFLRSLTSLI